MLVQTTHVGVAAGATKELHKEVIVGARTGLIVERGLESFDHTGSEFRRTKITQLTNTSIYFVGFAWRRVWSRRRRSRVHVTAQHRDLTIVVVAVNKLTSEVCLVAANNNFGNDRGRRPNDDYGIDIMEGHGFCFAQGGLSSRSMVLLTRLTFPENM